MKQTGVFVMCLVFLGLIGCTREVSPVSSIAIDSIDGGFRLTMECVRQDSAEAIATPTYLSVTGESISALMQKTGNISGNELYFEHTQVVLIDEKIAETGILEIMDSLCTQAKLPLTIRVAVVRGGTGYDLIQSNAQVFAVSDLLTYAAETGTMPDMPLHRITQVLHTDGTAVLPSIQVDEFEQIVPAGVAVFMNERLTCYLNEGEESETIA